MTWDALTLKDYLDRVVEVLQTTLERDAKESEQRFARLDGDIEDLQRRWSERFNVADVSHGVEIEKLRDQLSSLQAKVYIGSGITMTIAFVLPFLLRQLG